MEIYFNNIQLRLDYKKLLINCNLIPIIHKFIIKQLITIKL